MSGTQAMDILPKGAAEEFETYLQNMCLGINQLIDQTDKLADILDGKDKNSHTERIEDFLQSLAESATNSAQAVKEATDMALQKLKDKNDVVNSHIQDEYINQIEIQARYLDDINEYHGCNLGGGEAFTTDDEVNFYDFMEAVYGEWDTQLKRFQREAEDLAQVNVTNELSNMYSIIAEKLAKIRTVVEDNMETVGSHMVETHENLDERTANINREAESNLEQAVRNLQVNLEATAQALADMDF